MQMSVWKAKKGQIKVEYYKVRKRFIIFYLGVQIRKEKPDLYLANLPIHPVSNLALDN